MLKLLTIVLFAVSTFSISAADAPTPPPGLKGYTNQNGMHYFGKENCTQSPGNPYYVCAGASKYEDGTAWRIWASSNLPGIVCYSTFYTDSTKTKSTGLTVELYAGSRAPLNMWFYDFNKRTVDAWNIGFDKHGLPTVLIQCLPS